MHWARTPSRIVVLAVMLMTPAFPRAAASHVAGDVRGGYHADAKSGLIGGGVNADVGPSWDFNPNLEWTFVDGYDLWSLNADFHHDFDVAEPALWLGGGPALLVTDRGSVSPSDKDLGLNLVGGIGKKKGAMRPFAQLKVTLADNSASAMVFGLRF